MATLRSVGRVSGRPQMFRHAHCSIENIDCGRHPENFSIIIRRIKFFPCRIYESGYCGVYDTLSESVLGSLPYPSPVCLRHLHRWENGIEIENR